MGLKLYIDEAEEEVYGEMQKKLDLMSLKWVQEAKVRLSTAGGGVSSPIGGYPYKQTGHLHKNIAWARDRRLVNRVGTNVLYGKFLELKYNRPWMSLTNIRMIPTFKAIAGRSI